MRIEINVLKTIDNLYIYTTYYSNYNRKPVQYVKQTVSNFSINFRYISNEELTNKFD